MSTSGRRHEEILRERRWGNRQMNVVNEEFSWIVSFYSRFGGRLAAVTKSRSAWPRARSHSSPLRKSFLVLKALRLHVMTWRRVAGGGGARGWHARRFM